MNTSKTALQHMIDREIKSSPLANVEHFEKPVEALKAMSEVAPASPLAMWLMGRWVSMTEALRMAGHLESDFIQEHHRAAVMKCLHKMTDDEAQYPEFFDAANRLETMSCRLVEIEKLMCNAPSVALQFFFHGVYSTRISIH